MGIIGKQTIKGSFFSYLGVAFGFITVGILWPRFLEPEEIGVINFLVAISAILAHAGSLGINSVSIRLFPYFRDKDTRHHGFLFMALLFLLAGIIIIFSYYFLFKERIIANNTGKSFLVARYACFIVPFTIATLLFNLFDSLHKVIYNAVIGVFVKDFVFRLLNLVLILLYTAFAFRFNLFLNIYFIIFSVPALVLIILLYRTHQFDLSADFGFVRKDMRRSIADVSLFGLMGGMGTLIISNIDKIMINRLIDLEATGIYSIAFLFGAIITLPSRPLSKIATTIIAESWKRDDTETIRTIYSKSCLNQFIFAGLIFLLVWLNIDLVFQIIPPAYETGKYVILFMSLAGLVEMATGLNGMIISTSKYYRYQSMFIFFLLFLVILTNWIFIPRFGITGAAIASLLSTIIYNLVRAGFLYLKFKMQPFNYKFLIIATALLITLLAGYLLQGVENWLIRTLLICMSVGILYLAPLYFLRLSEDINSSVSAFISSLFRTSSKK
ncbi:MAG: polysaccharide biosynthesis C-terminal domain-containing protein [Bacteroidales bacterium]|nr:polysaccharide biosynthesis C-terminal domain-containing protein [Bacteroidales bacterium]